MQFTAITITPEQRVPASALFSLTQQISMGIGVKWALLCPAHDLGVTFLREVLIRGPGVHAHVDLGVD